MLIFVKIYSNFFLVDTNIMIWDLTKEVCIRKLIGHSNTIRCLEVDPKRQILISGSDDKTINIWNYETGQLIKTLKDQGEVTCLQINPINNLLISGSGDKTVKLWSLKDWKLVKTLKGHSGKITCLQAAGETFVTGMIFFY